MKKKYAFLYLSNTPPEDTFTRSVASVLGYVQIAEAVILHEGSTLLVVANGLRLLIWKPR